MAHLMNTFVEVFRPSEGKPVNTCPDRGFQEDGDTSERSLSLVSKILMVGHQTEPLRLPLKHPGGLPGDLWRAPSAMPVDLGSPWGQHAGLLVCVPDNEALHASLPAPLQGQPHGEPVTAVCV